MATKPKKASNSREVGKRTWADLMRRAIILLGAYHDEWPAGRSRNEVESSQHGPESDQPKQAADRRP
jgi:hypothetical protein